MRHRNALVGGAGIALAVITLTISAINDRRDRALLAGGHCTKIAEALHTPPPVAHTSCSGGDGSQSCTTWYSQREPYMRSLWRCLDEGHPREFWRRTAEELGR